MSTYLITGASRGLGLELVKQILAKEQGSKVIAGARKPTESKELVALQKAHSQALTLVTLDVDNTASVKAAAQQISNSHPGGIDYLVNNAGIMGSPFLNPDDLSAYNTNVAGPIRVTEAFLPLLKKGNKKIVYNISSIMGSITSQGNIHDFARKATIKADYINYRISKAALNAAVTAFAAEYKKDNIAFVSVHPGLVATDMALSMDVSDTSAVASSLITPETSVNGVLSVLHKLTFADSAKFYNYDGTPLPW